jgi:hypothetical protein
MHDNQTEPKVHPMRSLYDSNIGKTTEREINELRALKAGIGFSSDKIIALYLGAGRSTVWKWVKDGLLPPPIKITRSHSRWSNPELLPILIELGKGVSDD